MDGKTDTIAMTADIVSAYLSKTSVSVGDLPALIREVHSALANVAYGVDVATSGDGFAKPTPAQIRKSITPDALISFVDGKPYKTLKRHLTTHGLTVPEYRAKFGLGPDYPTTAPAYSAARSAMAKSLGLGQGGRRAKAATPAKARAKRPSTPG